mmetsp:Transcript_4341/g.12164  ORF Transcript_4341/g.12164 Transcript_4341/m.12164 type:complete len:403 (-) Transcript_4341:906-2114(-)
MTDWKQIVVMGGATAAALGGAMGAAYWYRTKGVNENEKEKEKERGKEDGVQDGGGKTQLITVLGLLKESMRDGEDGEKEQQKWLDVILTWVNHQAKREQMVKTGYLVPLTHLLSSRYTMKVRGEAAWCLSSFLMVPDYQSIFLDELSGLLLLLDLLYPEESSNVRGKDETAAVEHALRCLLNLSGVGANEKLLVEKGAIPILTEFLSHEDSAIVLLSVKILMNLSTLKENLLPMYEEGVLGKCIDLVAHRDETVVLRAIQICANMTDLEDEGLGPIVTWATGCVVQLLRIAGATPNHSICASCLQCLHRVLQQADKRTFLEMRKLPNSIVAMETLSRHIRSRTKLEELRLLSVNCLLVLISNDGMSTEQYSTVEDVMGTLLSDAENLALYEKAKMVLDAIAD